MSSSDLERIKAVVAPVVEGEGHDLYDVELAGAILRVLVDRPGGVDLEVLGQLTRSLSVALDAEDPMPGRYTLEVSSPGLERPLRTPAHFAAAVGRRAKVRTVAGAEGDRRLEGEVVAADGDGVTLATDGGERVVRYDEIERARTVFEWGPTPPPGKGKQKREKRKVQT
ncbi:MAG: ribosome maturation factor RimP [Acidimicrobiia bacterium]|nr:ribosome maturation factor RimP [Acidimicrobiia bacterium]